MGCLQLHNYTTLRIAHTSNTARSREGKSDAGLYKYKFQNKEWQDELSLNLYDYQARNYDPAIVRTTTYDPLAEKFYDFSPQSFLNNNPLRFIDPTGMESDDIIIRGKNVKTGAMEPAVVVKTDLINVTVDNENIPVIPTHDPITNKDNPTSPVVINGVDSQIKVLEATLGKADAISVNLSAGIVAGGGISVGGNMTAFLTGKDAGGVFMYSNNAPAPSVGLSVGGGVEVGAVFAAPSTASDFNRYTLTGPTVSVSGGYGPINGTGSVGIKSAFNWTPTSYSVSVGTGFSSFKAGAALSVTSTVLQGTLVQPPKR